MKIYSHPILKNLIAGAAYSISPESKCEEVIFLAPGKSQKKALRINLDKVHKLLSLNEFKEDKDLIKIFKDDFIQTTAKVWLKLFNAPDRLCLLWLNSLLFKQNEGLKSKRSNAPLCTKLRIGKNELEEFATLRGLTVPEVRKQLKRFLSSLFLAPEVWIGGSKAGKFENVLSEAPQTSRKFFRLFLFYKFC